MGYQLDLDEYPEQRLRDELKRREDARQNLLCDYCGRTGDTDACKFPDRHREATLAWQRQKRMEEGRLPVGTYVGGLHAQRPPKKKRSVRKGRHDAHKPNAKKRG